MDNMTDSQRVDNWRSWAQFVYLNGGVPEGTDSQLQLRVCETHDKETQELKDKIKILEGALNMSNVYPGDKV